MPIDTSMYNQNPMDSFTSSADSGYRLGQMIKKGNDERDLKETFRRNMEQGPDGTVSLNRQTFLSDLAQKNPEAALNYQKEFAAQDKQAAETRTMQMKQHFENMQMIGNLAASVNDQTTWDLARNQAIKLGLAKPNELPGAYDPNMVKQIRAQALTQKDQIELALKNAEIEKSKAETRKINSEVSTFPRALSEGQKAVDKDFAKDYNDWTNTGRSALDKNLQRLREAREALANDKSLTGPFAGLAPDVVRNYTNEKAIKIRDDVRAAAQGALKATLGSQFTEKEGERIMNQAYNERLSPEANIEKIDRAIQELEANRNANERKSAYFQKRGTLAGMDNTSPDKNSGGYPKTVRKGNQSATVSNAQEEKEAKAEGFI